VDKPLFNISLINRQADELTSFTTCLGRFIAFSLGWLNWSHCGLLDFTCPFIRGALSMSVGATHNITYHKEGCEGVCLGVTLGRDERRSKLCRPSSSYLVRLML
jgi:hypothetical protein